MMARLSHQFKENSEALPTVSPAEAIAYEKHFELLKAWNGRFNLVSRKSIEDAFAIHYADSLQIANAVHPFIGKLRMADLGTGAGFPGVIFAIRFPELPITLYEKSAKKRTFLSTAISELKLYNVSLEGIFPRQLAPTFLIARAVMPRPELLSFLMKHVPPGSRLAHNLGSGKYPDPLPRGFQLVGECVYDLPGDSGQRRIDVIEFKSK